MIFAAHLLSIMPATVVIYSVAICLLLFCSALLSGSEVAFFSLGPTEKDQLKQEDSRNALLAIKLLEKPQELLATILIVNNFVNVGVVIFSSALVNELFHTSGQTPALYFILEVLCITFLIIMIGEVVPKVYAAKNGCSFAKRMAIPLSVLMSIPPFSWLKSFLVNGTGLIRKYAKKQGVSISSDELEQAIALTKEETTSEEEQKILEGIIKFGNTEVRQIMRSRMEVVHLEEDYDFKRVMETVLDAGYSRIPVLQHSFDKVAGILYVKDLLPYIAEGEGFDWQPLIRKPFFVPENKKIDDLLKDFQEKKMHMAIVVDEYGGGSGLVTLEDVLEEIVGDITEEIDEDSMMFRQLPDGNYVFEGRTPLVDLYKVLGIDGKEFEEAKGEAETIGGFMVEKAGRILKNKEQIKFEKYKLIVESSDKRRIKSVKVVVEHR